MRWRLATHEKNNGVDVLPVRHAAAVARHPLLQDSDEIEANIRKLVATYKESRVYTEVRQHVAELEANPGGQPMQEWHS